MTNQSPPIPQGDTQSVLLPTDIIGVFCCIDADDIDRFLDKIINYHEDGYCWAGAQSVSRQVKNYSGEHEVDHINKNALDNRKKNLRCLPPALNKLRKKRRKIGTNTSKYPGVHYSRGYWTVDITIDSCRYSKTFAYEQDAVVYARNVYVENFSNLGFDVGALYDEL